MLAVGAKLYMLNLGVSLFPTKRTDLELSRDWSQASTVAQSGGIAPHEKAGLLHAGLTLSHNIGGLFASGQIQGA